MSSIQPASIGHRTGAGIALLLLASSLAAVAIAPTLMPDSYSWVEHSISESAAQGVPGAWLARLGLLLFGFAVLTLVAIAGSAWGLWGRLAHGFYGVSIIAAAAFAHRPWEDVPFDAFEDSLHSVASFGVGFAFTIGVIIVSLRRGPNAGPIRVLDALAVVSAVVIPMVMFNVSGIGGLVQRGMFLVAYLWYGVEAIQLARPKVQNIAGDSRLSSGSGRTARG